MLRAVDHMLAKLDACDDHLQHFLLVKIDASAVLERLSTQSTAGMDQTARTCKLPFLLVLSICSGLCRSRLMHQLCIVP